MISGEHLQILALSRRAKLCPMLCKEQRNRSRAIDPHLDSFKNIFKSTVQRDSINCFNCEINLLKLIVNIEKKKREKEKEKKIKQFFLKCVILLHISHEFLSEPISFHVQSSLLKEKEDI